MKNIFNSIKQIIMKEEKQNEPIVKDEEKKSMKENELKEVSGGLPRRPFDDKPCKNR